MQTHSLSWESLLRKIKLSLKKKKKKRHRLLSCPAIWKQEGLSGKCGELIFTGDMQAKLEEHFQGGNKEVQPSWTQWAKAFQVFATLKVVWGPEASPGSLLEMQNLRWLVCSLRSTALRYLRFSMRREITILQSLSSRCLQRASF